MVEPHEDDGLFGPGSVTWRVWTYPTSLTVGFQRTVVVEELDPALIAAVDATGAASSRPRTRHDRTLRYLATVAFGDSASAIRASDALVKIHARAAGTEPVGGGRHDANDPRSQLWVHLTAWHSILYAYERYGPGPLSATAEAHYWAECARAAELRTCDPDDVPRTRDGVREYFERMRPRLAASEAAQDMIDDRLHAKAMFPPTPRLLAPAVWVVDQALRRATIATMPHWMRRLAGVRQPRVVDALITPVMRVAFRVGQSNPKRALRMLGLLSPSTLPIVAPALLEIPAHRRGTVTPAQARRRHGVPAPTEADARVRRMSGDRALRAVR